MSDNLPTSLRSISVDQLFGRFDYKVPLDLPGDFRVGLIIITAPNGYGKSTLLRLLNDFAHGDYISLSQIKFKRFAVETKDSIALTIERMPTDPEKPTPRSKYAETMNLRFSLIDTESNGVIHDSFEAEVRTRYDEDEDEDRLPSRNISMTAERDFPFLRRLGPNEWRDVRDNSLLNRIEVARLLEGRGSGGRGLKVEEPSWLIDFRKGLKILYISANRLRVDTDSRAIRRFRNASIVEVWAERIREQIRDVIRRYADSGRRLEQHFPARIISALSAKKEVEQDEVFGLIGDVRLRESRYQNLGLVSGGQTSDIDKNISNQAVLMVLKVYLEDIKKKFEVLEEPADRLEIFVDTINSMLLFKQLRLSADSGFQIESDDGSVVPLSSLSSGEQHLIVLLGELVFGSTSGTVILLDEPEISFHPEWQEKFPKVLNKIIEINGCSIVMATHSPTLIQDNWDLVVELQDQV